MELSKRYAMKVNERKSFSSAAKALFVSQPALSLAVGRLEEELGFRIFDRSTSPLSLTPEGRIYMEYLYEEEEREHRVRARIRELSDLSSGSLSVGASCYTAYRILPGAISLFAGLHPGIKIKLDMGNEADEDVLYDRIDKGELDLILKYDYDPEKMIATPLLTERLCIAMHKNRVSERLVGYAISSKELISGDYPKEKCFSDPTVFSDIPFLRMGEHSTAMNIFRSILGEISYSPYDIFGARHTAMHYNLMREGLGAAFVSDLHVLTSGISDENIRYFVPGCDVTRTLFALRKKNAPYDPTAEAFINVTSEYCKSPAGMIPAEA